MKKGFTLAEVLITLGIIGVIAALTVPGLIGDTATRQNVTKFRKAHTVLSQALSTQTALTGTNINARNTTDYPTIADFFAGSLNVSDVNGLVVTTVDGMQFTFTTDGNACMKARAGTTINTGTDSNCYVLVDVDGANNGANEYLVPDGSDTVVKDQFYLEIYDTTVSAEDSTVEQFLLEGGNDMEKVPEAAAASTHS